MEIKIEVIEDDLNEDHTRTSDALFRELVHQYPEGVWERDKAGYRLLV
jgi:hypothetical protein